MGTIECICGPMYSGKSEELIRRIRRVEIAGYDPLVVKPIIDSRYSYTDVVSHSGLSREASVVEKSSDIINKFYGVEEVVAIDEVQFFDEGIIDVIKYLRGENVRVIIAGLDTDYRGEPFGQMGHILAIADKVDKLQAICHHCRGFNATMTQRLVDGEPAEWDAETIVVGGRESYEARCRGCWEAPVKTGDHPGQLTLF